MIIGGGIAGLSAAVTLCVNSDLDVLLIEKKRIGANQAIRAIFSEAISEFALQESVLKEYTGFIWHSPLGTEARFDYQYPELAGVDYSKLCQILYNRAVDNGLRCLTATAKRLSPNPISFDHTISIQLSDGKKIDTQVLIDASGFSQWAARQLGIRQSRHYSICYGELLTNCTIEATSYFRFLAPNQHYGNGGGWFYPTGNDSVSFGYSIVTRNLQEKQNNLVKGYADAKQSFHPYANWLQESQRQRIEAGIIPVGRIDQFVDHRLVIIGDAGGQAYPWSVEGCRPALYNGRSCARAILAAFESNQFDRSKLAVFEKEWQKENRERFWRTASVADIIWSQSDEQWDKMIKKTQRLSPQRQLYTLRDNRASWLAKIYAVGGYVRRRFVNWLYQFKQKFVK